MIYKNLLNQCDFESKIKNFCTKMTEEVTDEENKYYIKLKNFCNDIFSKEEIKEVKKVKIALELPQKKINKKRKHSRRR